MGCNSLTNQDGSQLEAHFEGYTYVPNGYLADRARTIQLSSSEDEANPNAPADSSDDECVRPPEVAEGGSSQSAHVMQGNASRSQPLPIQSSARGEKKAEA